MYSYFTHSVLLITFTFEIKTFKINPDENVSVQSVRQRLDAEDSEKHKHLSSCADLRESVHAAEACRVQGRTPELRSAGLQAEETRLLAPSTDRSAPHRH